MTIMFRKKFSKRMLDAMEVLFITRGATVRQLARAIYGNENRSGLNCIYRILRDLKSRKVIIGSTLYNHNSTGLFYYLNREGLEMMNYLFAIPPKYIGTGFDEDYGDFDFEGYKPPLTNLLHHLLFVDLIVTCYHIRKTQKDNKMSIDEMIDFRDNRYASVKYKDFVSTEIETKNQSNDEVNEETEPVERKQEQYHYRPDAEIKFVVPGLPDNEQTNICAVEIDRMTEKQPELKRKFEGYKRYFDYVKKNNQPLPAYTILFIVDSRASYQLTRRWHVVSGEFIKAMGEYASKVNLVFGTADQIPELIDREMNRYDQSQKALSMIASETFHNAEYIQNSGSREFQTLDHNLRFHDGHVPITLTKKKLQLFSYIQLEEYETIGWVLLEKAYSFAKSLELSKKQIEDSVPIAYYFNNDPKIKPGFQQLPPEEEKKYDKLAEEIYYYKIIDDKGQWLQSDLETFIKNPILEKLK